MRRSLPTLALLAACATPYLAPVDPSTDDDATPRDDTEVRDPVDEETGWAETGVEVPAAPTLLGAEVGFAVHCCTAPPDASTRVTPVISATVGEGVEFPAIGTGETAGAVAAAVDVGEARIDVVYGQATTTATGAFNGYVFELDGDGFQRLRGATLNAATTAARAKIAVTHDAHTVSVDLGGLTVQRGTRIAIDLQLE